jgi:hypothetical protein
VAVGEERSTPKRTGSPKNVLLATRVTPAIRDIVEQMSHREGLNVSEWLRNLIILELKRSQALPTTIRSPDLSLELDDDE